MKVTIEPAARNNGGLTVSISDPSDDIDCEHAVNMVLGALVVWGFSPLNVFEDRDTIKALEVEIKDLRLEIENLSGNRTPKKQKGVK